MLFRTAGVLLAVGATAMPTTRDTNAMNMQFEAKEEGCPFQEVIGKSGCAGKNELGLHHVISDMQCKQMCEEDCSCVSYEFFHGIAPASKKRCQLSTTCSNPSDMTNGTNGWKIYLRTCQCSTTGTGTGNGTAAPAFKAFEDRDELKGQVNLWVASESNRSAIEAKYGPITSWDVSSVTDMEEMFFYYEAPHDMFSQGQEDPNAMQGPFNEDISGWDVSSVTNMKSMFMGSNFNQAIGGWDVSSVTNMQSMFGASNFNQAIGGWDVSSVTNMAFMFSNDKAFNQDISGWDVSSVTNMQGMLNGVEVFNQSIGDWNVSSVTNMGNMLSNAKAFNQDIGGWDVSSVTNMANMFRRAFAFNRAIGGWDVSSVTNMASMFNEAKAFNQDISGWDVSSVTNMGSMFHEANNFDMAYIEDWTVKPQ